MTMTNHNEQNSYSSRANHNPQNKDLDAESIGEEGDVKDGDFRHAILSSSQRRFLLVALIAAAFIRIVTLGCYPLTDNTEARYAEVGREMLSSGDWIVPQLHGVKFWSKPPLSIWLTACSMKLFGVNEFAARLSALVPALLIVLLTYWLAAARYGRDYAMAAILVLVSSVVFFVGSGAVMTDAALCLGTTLSMVAFWQAVCRYGDKGRVWGYLFFLGLAIGLLAKGPVAVVLTLFPIGLWALWQKRWKKVWDRLPWIGGSLLAAALSLPWYLAVEERTPGFLDYFIIGEHWRRFTQPGWAGDLYGSAHERPRGTIWLFWILAAFPWSIYAIGSWVKFPLKFRAVFAKLRDMDEWSAYLILWAFSPMIFFSLADNILWTYALPGLPAFALLVSQKLLDAPLSGTPDPSAGRKARVFMACGILTPLVFGLLITVWFFFPFKNSQKQLVAAYLALRSNSDSQLVYIYERPYSAEFYSYGKALKAGSPGECRPFLQTGARNFFAIEKKRLPNLPEDIAQRLTRVGTYDKFLLLESRN